MNNLNSKKSFIAVLLTFSFMFSMSQASINSPYSRFGLGLESDANNPFYSSMGGLSYSVMNKNFINSKNPASYISSDSSRFVFNATIGGYYSKITSIENSSTTSYSNIESFKFAFPVLNRWKVSLGLQPFTNMGYNVVSTRQITNYSTDTVGMADYSYVGEGGISQFYFGNALKIFENLAVGVNISYLFGNISNLQTSILVDEAFAYRYRLDNTMKIKSLYFDYGLHYTLNLKNDYKLQLGLVYSNQQNINFSSYSQGITYTVGNNDYPYFNDTIIDSDTDNLKINYPAFFGGGLSLTNENWLVGVDFKYQSWSLFSNPIYNEELKDAFSVKIGGYHNIGERSKILFGLRYEESMVNLNKTNINNIGISFGVNIPLRKRLDIRSTGNISLGFEYLRSGTTDNNLIQQDYLRFFMGISIENQWFQKPKYQ